MTGARKLRTHSNAFGIENRHPSKFQRTFHSHGDGASIAVHDIRESVHQQHELHSMWRRLTLLTTARERSKSKRAANDLQWKAAQRCEMISDCNITHGSTLYVSGRVKGCAAISAEEITIAFSMMSAGAQGNRRGHRTRPEERILSDEVHQHASVRQLHVVGQGYILWHDRSVVEVIEYFDSNWMTDQKLVVRRDREILLQAQREIGHRR